MIPKNYFFSGINKTVIALILFSLAINASSQVILSADGNTDTYDLINSVLAPGYNVVEVPDCGHEEFGDHIDQAFDDELDTYVFCFHIHTEFDSDRCINYDRQRTEIKTYDKSPDNLIGTEGETVVYKWKFRLDIDFKASSSFTHLHQLKAVGGSEESMPLMTLTARKGTPDKLELRYAEALSQETIYQADLTPFKGYWVLATERITYGETGEYSINITLLQSGQSIFQYSSNNIRTWKTDADFIRPKWGIYRSLNDSENLRDEKVYFNDFSIEETNGTPVLETKGNQEFIIYPNPSTGEFTVSNILNKDIQIRNLHGELIFKLQNASTNQLSINNITSGLYLITLRFGNNIATQKLVVN
ncbi:T9SS type A sorting domain-containing protein [Saccharicrinis sp. GN24d3]|uniref:T9SS type A sorting domain-containing protein n=1 Tax=Saccharicrinis sp. GN24d3 TaxID=3458416 RepID=UPI00403651D4